MKNLIRNFLAAERWKGIGFAFRYTWLRIFVLFKGGYSCFYCHWGSVRFLPAKCPLCQKYLSLHVTLDTTLEELVGATLRNGVIVDFKLKPKVEYALAE